MGIAFSPLIVTCIGYSVFEWLEARKLRERVMSRWHLLGAALAVVIWILFSTRPPGSSDEEIQIACSLPPLGISTATCRADASFAEWGNQIVSWTTLGVVILLAAIGRHSRIAAWSSMAMALVGQTLALQFIQEFLRQYG